MKIIILLILFTTFQTYSQEVNGNKIKSVTVIIVTEYDNCEKEVNTEKYLLDTNNRITISIIDGNVTYYNEYFKDSCLVYSLKCDSIKSFPDYYNRVIDIYNSKDVSPFDIVMNKYNLISSCKRRFFDYFQTYYYYYTWYEK